MADCVDIRRTKNELPTLVMSAFTVELDKIKWIDVAPKEGNEKHHMYFRYDLANDGTLSIWMLNEKELEDAVNTKKLKGSAVHGEIEIEDTPENVRAYLKNTPAEKLFVLYGKYKKVPDTVLKVFESGFDAPGSGKKGVEIEKPKSGDKEKSDKP